MRALTSIVYDLVELFIEDGALALAILCIVTLAVLLAFMMPSLSLVAGAILVVGCPIVLFINAVRAAQHKRGG
jgi:hypothetical protein